MSTDAAPRDRPLFRAQALAAGSTGWLGAIRIAQPLGDLACAATAAIVVALIAAFASFGSYTRRATVPGLLEPVGGIVRLTTPAMGTVEQSALVEGAHVAAGDTLVVVSAERQSAAGGTQGLIATQLEARRATLDRDRRLSDERHAARTRATRERLDALDVELAHLGLEAGLHAARETIARKNVERFDELARTGFISPLQAQARLDEALVLQAQRETDGRVEANLRRERIGLASQLVESRMQADSEAMELARAIAALDQERAENAARRSTVIAAPFAATVTGIAVHVGQQVGAGGLVATLIPDGAVLEAQLFASARQVGFVETGQRVRMRYAAYPYQKFGMGEGVVGSIEKSPYAPQELPAWVASIVGTPLGGEPVYRIVVTLDRQTIDTYAKPQPLRPGMVFEADVIQDHRRLHEWLFEPIYGLIGR